MPFLIGQVGLVSVRLANMQRLILVGDPSQLPPIGIGRPIADLVAFLDEATQKQTEEAKALARLRARGRAPPEAGRE